MSSITSRKKKKPIKSITKNGTKYQVTIPKGFVELSGWLLKTKPKAPIFINYDAEKDALIIKSRFALPPVTEEGKVALQEALQNKKTKRILEQIKPKDKSYKTRIVDVENLPEDVRKDKVVMNYYKEAEKIKKFLDKEEEKYKSKIADKKRAYELLQIDIRNRIDKILG
jgi:hypothetical protein